MTSGSRERRGTRETEVVDHATAGDDAGIGDRATGACVAVGEDAALARRG